MGRCAEGDWGEIGVRLGARGRPLGDVLGDGGRESLPVVGEKAGGRRGCQSHVNLQFSCSFFLQGEGTPNGRLRKRAGRLDMVGAGGGALDSAMRWDCGRRRKLCGRCCLEWCCRDRQLQVEGGGARSFGGFAEILRLLGSPERAWPQHCEREARRRRLRDSLS